MTHFILNIRLSCEAKFTFYDDDMDARTKEIVAIRTSKQPAQTVLEVGQSRKTYIARFNGTTAPAHVTLNGTALPRMESLAALEAGNAGWYDDLSPVVYAKFAAGRRQSQLALVYS